MSLNLIPIICQLNTRFTEWTIGIGVVMFPDETAGALFHLGYSEDTGMTFDCFWITLILQKFN